MEIDAKQLDKRFPPRKVGLLKGRPVMHVRCKGGWQFVCAPKGTAWETLGAGHHWVVAQHLAGRHEPDITWTELSKADHVDIRAYEYLLPEYQAVTERIRALESGQG